MQQQLVIFFLNMFNRGARNIEQTLTMKTVMSQIATDLAGFKRLMALKNVHF